jgi:hypothetical protein
MPEEFDVNGNPILVKPSEPHPPSLVEEFDVRGNPIRLGSKPPGEFPLPEVTKKAAPYVGRAVAETGPMIGGMLGGPLGAAGGYGISQILKKASPDYFGKPQEDIAGLIGGAGTEALLQGFLPRGVEAALSAARHPIVNALSSAPLKNFPSVKGGAAREMTDQIMKQFGGSESGILLKGGEKAAANFDEMLGYVNEARDKLRKAKKFGTFSEEDSQAALDEATQLMRETFGGNVVGKQLVRLRKEFEAGADVAATQSYKQVANTALSDITHVRNFKIATGSPREIEQLALNKLVTNGFKDSEGRINANQIINELSDKNAEIYKEAISPDKLGTLKSLLNEIQTQEKRGVTDRVVNWSEGHLTWSLAGLKFLGLTGGVPIALAATNKGLAKLMENPQTAKLVVVAMRTSTNAPEAPFVSKLLASVVRPGGAAAQVARIPIAAMSVPEE